MTTAPGDRPKCEVCGGPPETVDVVNGYRCAAHPSTYNREWAAKLVAWGFPGLARAHRRLHIALLAERIQRRNP